METFSSNTSSSNPVHWHILGAGSIGCLWAAHLSESGQQVTLLLKNNDGLNNFLKTNGITLERDNEQFLFSVNAQLCTEKDVPIKYLIVCTKSFDTVNAIQSIEHRITEGTRILLLQNGMGPQQTTAELLPKNTIICGTTTDGAFRRSPYDIVFAGHGLTCFGFHRKDAHWPCGEVSKELLDLFTRVKLKVVWDEDIQIRLWHKLAINCVINPITAINKCKNGEILKSDKDLRLIKDLCLEIEAVMSQTNIPRYEPSLYDNVLSIAHSTGNNFSSMHQDIVHEKQTEIEAISGFLCRQADKLNIPVPANRKVYDAILALQNNFK